MSALLERLAGLVLLQPVLLALGLLLPLAYWLGRRRRPRAAPVSTAAFLQALPSVRSVLQPLPTVLAILGMLAIVWACAHPAARKPRPQTKQGIDIVLCLDTSSSMNAKDLDRERTRLEVARDAAARFVASRPQDRIGLVSFARYPDLRCPPTLDHGALARILDEVAAVAGDGPEDATGIGAAVARCAEVLQRGRARSRVVILLTDGEENVALEGAPDEIAPIHAAQLCRRLGVRVYAIAAGIMRRDPTGAWVRLDTRPIEHLAERTGGAFHPVRDARALDAVYGRIDAMEKAPLEDPRYVLADRRLGFAVLALVLLVLGRLLGATWLRVRP